MGGRGPTGGGRLEWWWESPEDGGGDHPERACLFGNVADLDAKAKWPAWTVFEGCHDGYPGLSPVGSFPTADAGIDFEAFDMLGNVWEWTGDWHSSTAAELPADIRSDWGGPGSGSDRVGRGASFWNDPAVARVADRGGIDPGWRYPVLGLRLARSFR